MKDKDARERLALISIIAKRGMEILTAHDIHANFRSIIMDIESADQDIPLDLDKFLAFDDFNFSHDFVGIYTHMDRSSFPGKLTGCFVPRCARTDVDFVEHCMDLVDNDPDLAGDQL